MSGATENNRLFGCASRLHRLAPLPTPIVPLTTTEGQRAWFYAEHVLWQGNFGSYVVKRDAGTRHCATEPGTRNSSISRESSPVGVRGDEKSPGRFGRSPMVGRRAKPFEAVCLGFWFFCTYRAKRRINPKTVISKGQ